MAQQVIYEPGYCAFYYPNANCQNKGPGNPYTGTRLASARATRGMARRPAGAAREEAHVPIRRHACSDDSAAFAEARFDTARKFCESIGGPPASGPPMFARPRPTGSIVERQAPLWLPAEPAATRITLH